ncbi:MAG TPA: adventurous gliding motility protein CglE [Polyangia bacterium]|nr:adventurous gliding motility protein CglE [Polyangia bacterium]
MRRPLFRLAVAAAAFFLIAPTRARAQVTDVPNPAIFPDPAKFAHGLYTEGEIGALMFFGNAREWIGPGFALGGRVGYDLTRWLAVQAHAIGSTHETRFDGMPQAGQIIQLYQGTAELKVTVRIVQTSIFVEGGGGVARLSTNILETVGGSDQRNGLTAGGGAGVDYHSLSRHFSLGLRAGYFWLRDIKGSEQVTATTYLRYTF